MMLRRLPRILDQSRYSKCLPKNAALFLILCFRLIRNCARVVEKDGEKSYLSNKNYWLVAFESKRGMEGILNELLKPIVEEWTKISLGFSQFYGIRRYTRGARLWAHVDDCSFICLGAVLQIDQKVDENWPLHIIDNQGTTHSIFLQPGEMLLYESGAVAHGRQYALNGDYYDNLLVHWTPNDDIPHLKDVDVEQEIINAMIRKEKSSKTE